jgi:hypothetical protein
MHRLVGWVDDQLKMGQTSAIEDRCQLTRSQYSSADQLIFVELIVAPQRLLAADNNRDDNRSRRMN